MIAMFFVAWKELIELGRNARLIPVILVAPVVQLFLLGYAATTDVSNVPIVIADGDRSPASRDLIGRFEASPYFSIVELTTTAAEVDPFLERGQARMALAVPAGYGEAIAAGRPTAIQVLADGTDSNSTTVALGYATSLIGTLALEGAQRLARVAVGPARSGGAVGADAVGSARLGGAVGAGFKPAPPVDIEIRVWFNPELDSQLFMIPGVFALLLLTVTANLSSMGVVREKEVGTLEQLNVTPLARWQLIAGKLVPYGVVGLADAALVLALAIFWFEVPLRGSLTLLVAMSIIYLACTLGLGLFVSTISDTQQQALMTTVFFFLVPMVYLSGFVFPIENMPEPMQAVTYLIPLRYYLIILRGVFLKGVGIDVLWPQALGLVLWGGIVLGLAVSRLRKTAG